MSINKPYYGSPLDGETIIIPVSLDHMFFIVLYNTHRILKQLHIDLFSLHWYFIIISIQ